MKYRKMGNLTRDLRFHPKAFGDKRINLLNSYILILLSIPDKDSLVIKRTLIPDETIKVHPALTIFKYPDGAFSSSLNFFLN